MHRSFQTPERCFVLNEHDNAVTQCVVHVKKNEVPGYIKLLEIAREKLQDF